MKRGSTWAAVIFLPLMLSSVCVYGDPVVKDSPSTITAQDAVKNLSDLADLIVLDASDAKHYSSNLQDLVGQYYQLITVNGRPSLQLLGRATDDLKVDKVELKDKILFNNVTDNSYNAGVNIPWLNFKATSDEKLETLIQDIASVTAPSSGTFIGQHLPSSAAIDPKLNVYYASGATVTIISQKAYSSKNIDGSVPIITLGGNKAYARNILTNAWVVSVTKILAARGSGIMILDNKDELYKSAKSVPGMVVKVLPPKVKKKTAPPNSAKIPRHADK